MIPEIRIQVLNEEPVDEKGKFVIYWMIANRRAASNFALDRAVEWSRRLGKSLLVLEPIRCDYRWASDRLHRFVLDGMAQNARDFESSPAYYYPYVEPKPGAGRGLLRALSEHAAVAVTDDYPCFFLPRAVRSAAQQVRIRLEAVDSNGLLPLRSAEKVYSTAYAFRRFLQKNLTEHLTFRPRPRPLANLDIPRLNRPPEKILERWPRASTALLRGETEALRSLPIDHGVAPVKIRGGHRHGKVLMGRFLTDKLHAYSESRNHPDEDGTSGLSPYLHFGHLSVHEVFQSVVKHENWSNEKIGKPSTGARSGWWGMSVSAESFLDELITWRELGFNMAWQRGDFEEYRSLPDWVRETLARHGKDPRPHRYSLGELEEARTHDRIWNAAQTELVTEGRIHNYLRMLWGKKILEWSRTPREALAAMIDLNNKYGVDGRDPNSVSGIFWVLGRYDRPWGPERPIFGTVRYMSSENTARKLRLRNYLERYTR
jgi:deoxyribodipyrimidine photo-lyase